MPRTIARPFASNQRIFPFVTPSLYDSSHHETAETADQKASRRVLAMGTQHRSLRERLGLSLNGSGVIRRLLSMHRLGMKAELSGRFARADFFWTEVMRSIRKLAPDHSAWTEVATLLSSSEPTMEVLKVPNELRDRFIQELLIDTHCAFFNGHLTASTGPNGRAFAHIDYLKQLVGFVSSAEQLRTAIVGESTLTYIDTYLKAKQPEGALRLVRELNETFPNNIPYQDKASEVHFLAATKNLSSKTTGPASLDEAKQLLTRIRNLEEFHRTHSYSLGCFDALASLYHIRAIKLANGSRPSQALSAVELALAHKPNWSDAKKSRQRIESSLRVLQSDMDRIKSKLGVQESRDGVLVTNLNEEREALTREANSGFGPRDDVRRHSTNRIAKRLAQAQAVNKWVNLGLPPPDDGDWGLQAECLLKIIEHLGNKNPTEVASLTTAWYEVWSKHPELPMDQLSPDLIERYFRRFTDEQGPIKEQSYTPLLPSVPEQSWHNHGPFDLWLLSRRDIRLKAEAAAAILLIAVGLFLLHLDARNKNVRDLAYDRLREALKRTDYAAALTMAKEFLEAPPLHGEDQRLGQVKDWYTEAFTRWFIQRPEGPPAKLQVDRYRKLTTDVKP